jgi:hypothetical protein
VDKRGQRIALQFILMQETPSGSQIIGRLTCSAILMLASLPFARAQLATCFAGFEISPACITERGLHEKAMAYQRKITEAMPRLGASYKIDLRLVNNPVEAGYNAATISDVFTDVVRDDEMRNHSFIINVTTDFLERQPEILFESSSLHEVCHVMNDDLTGYHRNGANIEAAEEHCVLQVTGESRYQEYLQAYAKYQHWDTPTYETVLRKVKDVILVPAPSETDEADKLAAAYFRTHADGKEHLLVYNGELHEAENLKEVIKAGKPMIFFHNHQPHNGRAAMFPSSDDFGTAGLFLFMVYRENPSLAVEFRVMHLGEEVTTVSYGFKGTAVEDIKKVASEYRNAVSLKADATEVEIKQSLLANRLAQDSFKEYLQHACPVALAHKNADICRTHPQYFIWPSDRFFIHYRPQ